jgi:cystine transport system permease protein
MFMATQRIVAVTYEPLALYIEVAIIYLIFSTGLTSLQRYTEKRLNNKTVNAKLERQLNIIKNMEK